MTKPKKKQFIIEVDESEIVECWNEQAAKELGYQEYALKQCPKIKVKPYNPTVDCISREELKKAMWSLVINENDDIPVLNAIETIDNAQALERPQDEWIPVSERLPEEYGNYLVFTSDNDIDIGLYHSNTPDAWSLCDANGFYWTGDKNIEVIAWRPLPEPYKKGGAE